jgi:hypothetical protein
VLFSPRQSLHRSSCSSSKLPEETIPNPQQLASRPKEVNAMKTMKNKALIAAVIAAPLLLLVLETAGRQNG